MKKLLALVLALVMTLSLCTISNAAYSDAKDVDYKEAVDVLTAVGVFVGDGSGNFYPDQNLTRAQAAKVISYLLLGQKVADGIQGSGTVFTDVAASHWAVGYIEYCASVGVLAGIGDGKFDPNGQLTGLAFAKMLLVALGYDATYEGYTGANWSINVAKKATDLELFDGNDDIVMSAVVTRQEAAQYAFNALQTQTVTAQKGTTMNVNGVTVVTSGEPAVPNTAAGNPDTIDYNNTDDNAQQLCEKLYGNKLVLNTTTNDAGKQVNVWYYNKNGATGMDKADKVGTYVTEAADKTIVATKAGKSLQYWLETVNTKWKAPSAGANIIVNGVADNDASTTIAKGDEILVFISKTDANNVTKVIINHYTTASIANVTAVSGKTYDYTIKIGNRTYTSDNVPGFDAETYVKDAKLLVLYKGTTADLVSTKVADIVVGKMTEKGDTYIKVDGVKYTFIDGDTPNFDDTYNFYLDNNGYILDFGVKVAADTTDGYVYLLDAADQAYDASSDLGITTGKDAEVKVKVMYMDGTVETVDYEIKKATAAITTGLNANDAIDHDEGGADTNAVIRKGDYYVVVDGKKYEVGATNLVGSNKALNTNGGFYAYSKNAAGEITLKTAVNNTKGTDFTAAVTTTNGDNTLVKGKMVIGGSYTANSSTKVVVVAYDSTAETATTASYVGYKNFPALSGGESLLKNLPALVCYTKGSTIANTVYVVKNGAGVEAPGADVTYGYYTGSYTIGADNFYQFYVDGKTETLKNTTLDGSFVEGAVYTITNNAAQLAATNYKAIVTETDEAFFVTGAASNATKVYADKCKVWDLTGDEVVAGTIAEGDSVKYVYADNEVKVVYIVDSFVEEQATTATDAIYLMSDDSSDPYIANMEKIVSLNLTQSVDNSTIYLSGVVTAMTDTAAQKAGMKAFYDSETDTAAEMLAHYNKFEQTNGKVGFVLVSVNDGWMVIVVGMDDTDNGKVINKEGNTSAVYTIGGVDVTVDFTGLSF